MIKILTDVLRYIKYKIYINKKYKTEIKLIKKTHKTQNNNPSIIYFSFNKAATQYVKSILKKCAIQNGMVPVQMAEYAFETDFPYLPGAGFEVFELYKHIFKEKGYIYGPFAGMINGIDHFEKYKIIFMTRDPRDLLVSSFFSFGWSHPTPKYGSNKTNDFINRRREIQSKKIDEFVISESEKVFSRFTKYQEELIEKHKNIHLTSYEKMNCDFKNWLNEIINYAGFNLSEQFISEIIENNKIIKTGKENPKKHMRKGVPGDYKEKLSPETISYLNKKYYKTLMYYNYLE